MTNIYVGNLALAASEVELRELFQAHGTVEAVTIVKDRDTGQPRGFGFVEMTNSAEAVKAIAALNGVVLAGAALSVNEARPKVVHDKSRSEGQRRHRDHRA